MNLLEVIIVILLIVLGIFLFVWFDTLGATLDRDLVSQILHLL